MIENKDNITDMAIRLAMLVLQSDLYRKDADAKDAVDDILLAVKEVGAP